MFSTKILQFIIVQITIGCSIGQPKQQCFRNDYRYIKDTQSFYKTHPTPRTWHEAEMVCASEDANLLIVEDEKEAQLMGSYMKETISHPEPPWIPLSVYVGITDLAVEGSFKTIDGRSISQVYNRWMERQPDNNHFSQVPENCVQFFDHGYINDYLCSVVLPFICKKSIDSQYSYRGTNKGQTENNIKFRNDYKYVEATRSFYKTHLIPTTWVEAQRICAGESASLLVVEDQDEANVIVSSMEETANDKSLIKPKFNTMHVGISDLEAEGTFKTLDGRPISDVYSKWANGQPDSADPGDDCVEITPSGELNDVSCNNPLRFICKRSLDSLQRTHETSFENNPFFRNDYEYSAVTRSFYKTHLDFKPWKEARVACANENAKLIVIEDQKEADIIRPFLEKNKLFSVHVGIAELTTKGVFETIDGRPLSEVYHKWNTNEPNNYKGKEDCLEIIHHGGLNDVICDIKIGFICKKTLDSLRWNYECPQTVASCEPTATEVRGSNACAGQTIFEENFDNFNKNVWQVEQYIPGVHTPQYPFVSYQRLSTNPTVYVDKGVLHITPRLQQNLPGFDSAYIISGTLNLLSGCTASAEACIKRSWGADILPPIVSGKITSKAFSFKYGTVYIRAKLPQGDWIYPEILLEPYLKKYGSQHYASGIINIASARGNRELGNGTTDFSNKVLYGGPVMDVQCHDKLLVNKVSNRGFWGDDFHDFAVRWAPDGITLSVDGVEWARTDAPAQGLHTLLPATCRQVPRSLLELGSMMAPFDDHFYITLGLAVGGITEFPDGLRSAGGSPKPWTNPSRKALFNFWEDLPAWLTTWWQPRLSVDYVKIVAL